MSIQDKVVIMTAEQYFEKYAKEGIGNGADRWMVRRQLIDAFHKEIFGLVTLRTKILCNSINDIPEGDPEAMRIAKNVIHDTTMKWKKLCKMFSMYIETANLLKPEDLKLYDEIEEIGTTTEDIAEQKAKEEEPDGGHGAENAEDQPAGIEAPVQEPDPERTGGSAERSGSPDEDPEGHEDGSGSVVPPAEAADEEVNPVP